MWAPEVAHSFSFRSCKQHGVFFGELVEAPLGMPSVLRAASPRIRLPADFLASPESRAAAKNAASTPPPKDKEYDPK